VILVLGCKINDFDCGRQVGGEALDKLKPKKADKKSAAGHKTARESNIRAMTYNIHSCVNMDGQVNLERIAAVIDELAPDLVALQEVDVDMPRTHNQDQPKILGKMLNMDYRFFPVVVNGYQKYGLAMLSRFPFQNVRVGRLPALSPRLKLNLQKRGVIWAILETSFGSVHFFNTHLSLFRLERRKQMKVLLGEEWLMAVPKDEPVILCGDFNAVPLSPVYRQLSRYLTDTQRGAIHSDRRHPTFPSRGPFFRIDHIFISAHFRSVKAIVPNNKKTRIASDHLPLCADLEMIMLKDRQMK
jgi:endonuclease/exonuclease/phosphatase family metal-dependent hydrolase